MNLKLLFFCLFLAVLLIPAEFKRGKHKHGESHRGHWRHDKHHKHDRHDGHGKHEKKRMKFEDIIHDFFFELIGEDDEDDDDRSNWLEELQEPQGQCNPNPCRNNGVCEEKRKGKFKCDCPKPFKGRKCEKGPKHCRRGRCGRGECVLTSTPPFYECKCKLPFQPPDCRTYAVCDPSPCKNGGTCVIDGNDFDCVCPEGFRGSLCQVDPNDCYEDDGESYRGKVSETKDGEECLNWNSQFIVDIFDPFNAYEDTDGLGHHNFCRNPDGSREPWCFYRKGRNLRWDYCDVTECPEPTGEPTEIVPTEPQPTKPKPTEPEPTEPEPTEPKPTEPKPTEPKPTEPKPTDNQPPTTKQPPAEKTTQASQPSTTTAVIQPTTTTQPQQFSTCGIPEPKKGRHRIIGGLKAPPGQIPWQVSLQVKTKGAIGPYRHNCGGVLIASCWVLTAGHCLEPNKDMQVVMGTLSLDVLDPGAQVVQVEKAIRHERYTETPSSVHNDIALLKLQGPAGFCANETQFVKTACLPDAQLPDGTECRISGWGVTEQSNYGSSHLLHANVLLINQEKCSSKDVYGNVLDNSMFCAGFLQGGVDSCQGDSGGPLTCQPNKPHDEAHVVYGLVSWGDECGRKNKPGVYTQVTQFLDWIKANSEGAIQ
ncbi:hyaluronan-binding protein 2-like [Pholidichthys leucotaenia]